VAIAANVMIISTGGNGNGESRVKCKYYFDMCIFIGSVMICSCNVNRLCSFVSFSFAVLIIAKAFKKKKN